MADVVARTTQPALGAIKLAWWRERLEELDAGVVPAEPRLQAAAEQLLTRGITGAQLAALEDGWAALLDAAPDLARADERGARLFGIGARLLGGDTADASIAAAGRLYGAADIWRRGLTENRLGYSSEQRWRVPTRARAMTGLAALAARDLRRGGAPFEPQATPGRARTLLWHRLTGRI